MDGATNRFGHGWSSNGGHMDHGGMVPKHSS